MGGLEYWVFTLYPVQLLCQLIQKIKVRIFQYFSPKETIEMFSSAENSAIYYCSAGKLLI